MKFGGGMRYESRRTILILVRIGRPIYMKIISKRGSCR